MQEIKIYADKINNGIFRSSDISLLEKILNQNARAGRIKLSKEDLRMFQIYAFALQQLELEEGSSSHDVYKGDWRQTVDDLSQLKYFIDVMEEKGVISNVAWNVSGMAIFDIPDKKIYREYIYSIIINHLNKLCEIQ